MVNCLNNRGKSCIVWSGDRDLIQLVNYSKLMMHIHYGITILKSQLYAYEGLNKIWKSASADIIKDDMLFNMGGQHMLRDNYQKRYYDWIKLIRFLLRS